MNLLTCRTMRTRVAGVTVVIALLAGAGSADAATGWRPPGIRAAPAGEYGKLMESLPVARSYWPGSPCDGREHVYLDSGQKIDALYSRASQGMADPATCTVWIRGGLSYSRFCFVLAHEFGHLAGHGHSDDAWSIMYLTGRAVGPCVETVDHRREAWYEMVAALPWGGRGWRITRKAGTRMVASHPRGCPRDLRFRRTSGTWVWSVAHRSGC